MKLIILSSTADILWVRELSLTLQSTADKIFLCEVSLGVNGTLNFCHLFLCLYAMIFFWCIEITDVQQVEHQLLHKDTKAAEKGRSLS